LSIIILKSTLKKRRNIHVDLDPHTSVRAEKAYSNSNKSEGIVRAQ
jgi:hypothetical protein